MICPPMGNIQCQCNESCGEQLQIVRIQTHLDHQRDDHIVRDGADDHTGQTEGEIPEDLAEQNLADDHGGQADDDGAPAHIHGDAAQVLGIERTAEAHKTVGKDQACQLHGIRVDAQNGSTLFNLGAIDLSKYSRIEITYGSDGNAKLGDEGCFFALDDHASLVTNANSEDIIGSVAAENATAAWTGDRTAVIDLSQVEYSGDVYLTFYMGHINGISMYSILLYE